MSAPARRRAAADLNRRTAGPAVAVEIDEIVVHGLPLPDPAAFGDLVRARLADLVSARGLPDPGRENASPSVRLATDRDTGALADGVAEAIWAGLRSTP